MGRIGAIVLLRGGRGWWVGVEGLLGNLPHEERQVSNRSLSLLTKSSELRAETHPQPHDERQRSAYRPEDEHPPQADAKCLAHRLL